MKKIIYLIHHSHTDIGYTHPQEIIKLYHVDFINQAIAIFKDPNNDSFRWTCENFWQVENYLKYAKDEQIEQLISLMQQGKIDYSLNYLNMTELIDMNIYEEKLSKAVEFSELYKLNFNTAMSADINGYSKLFVEKLAKLGITNNITCVHTHHGAHAFGKKPYIFNWETKYGRVRTVLAPHYHVGNELFMMPNAGTTYLLDDNIYGIDSDNSNLQITRERVLKYLEDIKANEEYQYDFLPIMVSGVISDNGMPNNTVCNTIELWNETYDDIEIKLVTLDELFKEIDEKDLDLPIHSGDMNDWWADGVGSTPKGTKLFKSAQRKYNLLKKLNPEYTNKDVVTNLILYAEHTWGHSASISNPYNALVDEMMLKKQNYALNAHNQINEDLELYLLNNDKVTILPDRDKIFKVINTLSTEVKTTGIIVLEHWEMVDGIAIQNCKDHLIVKDKVGNILSSQVRPSDRGHEIEFEIKLKANESQIVKVERGESKRSSVRNEVCDKVNDFRNKRSSRYISNCYETEYYKLKVDTTNNIIELYDKELKCKVSESDDFLKLITTSTVAADACNNRRRMGRNRISGMSNREVSGRVNFEYLEIGSVYSIVRVHQKHPEMIEAYVDVKLYNNIKKIDINVNYLKQATKNIENIYFNFNLTKAEAKSTIVSKSADEFDPSNDLLPEVNNEFYICGESLTTNNYTILSPDCALVTFNNGEYNEIDLQKIPSKEQLTFWLANNFWETNFYTDLSGYYNFRFVLDDKQCNKTTAYSFENPIVYSTNEPIGETNVQ